MGKHILVADVPGIFTINTLVFVGSSHKSVLETVLLNGSQIHSTDVHMCVTGVLFLLLIRQLCFLTYKCVLTPLRVAKSFSVDLLVPKERLIIILQRIICSLLVRYVMKLKVAT